jgi:uncharacterized protein YbjT (DUF2867 family)
MPRDLDTVPPPARRIAVTGANSSTGRRLLTHLATTPTATTPTAAATETTALVRQYAELPATRIVTDWTSSPQALEAVQAADIVIHLSGVFAGPDWQTHYDGTVATAKRVATATRPGQRLLYLSYVDADATASNWYQRAKGLAEQILAGSPADTLILRIPPIIYGTIEPGAFERRMLPSEPGSPITVIGDGGKRFRPLYSGDLIAALVAACTTGAPGTWDLVGPESLSVNEIVHRLNGPHVTVRHLPTEVVAVPQSVIDLFTEPGRQPDVGTAWRMLGMTPTPLAAIWPPVASR